jgi:hypothetical protein
MTTNAGPGVTSMTTPISTTVVPTTATTIRRATRQLRLASAPDDFDNLIVQPDIGKIDAKRKRSRFGIASTQVCKDCDVSLYDLASVPPPVSVSANGGG